VLSTLIWNPRISWCPGERRYGGPTAARDPRVTAKITGPGHSFNYCRFGWTVNWKPLLLLLLLLLLYIIARYYYLYKGVTRSRPRVSRGTARKRIGRLSTAVWRPRFSRDVTLRGRRITPTPDDVPRGIFLRPLNAFKRNYSVSASSEQWALRFAADTWKPFEHTTRETDIAWSCGDSLSRP